MIVKMTSRRLGAKLLYKMVYYEQFFSDDDSTERQRQDFEERGVHA